MNSPGPGYDLGEVSINLQPGINTFDLFGNRLFPQNQYYGVVLFFDGSVLPQATVFNANGSSGSFLIQPSGNTLICSANGGSFFCPSPGTNLYIDPDGSTLEIIGFTVDSIHPSIDFVSPVNIGADGYPDTVAQLSLKFTPASVPEPPSMVLFGIALGVIGFLKMVAGRVSVSA